MAATGNAFLFSQVNLPAEWAEDLRDGKPLGAAEFAVHLDDVHNNCAPPDYQKPDRFFARTYLTRNLTTLGGEVIRRLAEQLPLAGLTRSGEVPAQKWMVAALGRSDARGRWRSQASAASRCGQDRSTRTTTTPAPPACSPRRPHPTWPCVRGAVAAGALLVLVAGWPAAAPEAPPPVPRPVQASLEREDWPALLDGLAGHPLTNSILRLVAVRALFETGRLPEEQFAWFHRSGPELLSTGDLQDYAGAAHLGETLLQLGYLNGAERLAFDSLEMEGENPSALRTLARLHLVKGLTNAALVFLTRLDAYPDHRPWVARFRAGLAADPPAEPDPTLPRIRTNLVTGDRIVSGLTTERLLRQALESNAANPMAFQYLMAHQLLERRLLFALRTLTHASPTREGPLPRHYAEAVLLHQSLYPGLSVATLRPRVPPAVAERFQAFRELMRSAGAPERAQAQAWRDFRDTYWYYYFFGQGPAPPGSPVPKPPDPHG